MKRRDEGEKKSAKFRDARARARRDRRGAAARGAETAAAVTPSKFQTVAGLMALITLIRGKIRGISADGREAIICAANAGNVATRGNASDNPISRARAAMIRETEKDSRLRSRMHRSSSARIDGESCGMLYRRKFHSGKLREESRAEGKRERIARHPLSLPEKALICTHRLCILN